jgi:quercetin dioxygenase-like cupin family protein
LAGEVGAGRGSGALWRLTASDDLQANLVRLEPDHEIGAHRNTEVDVVLVVLEGGGELEVERRLHPLQPMTIAHLPKGTARSIRAGDSALVYLTIHRRRAGLTIGPGVGPGPRRPPGFVE